MKLYSAKKSMAAALALAVLLSQSGGALAESEEAKVYEYEGTTQISSTDYYPDFDTSAVTLTVEDVYVSSGSTVQEGDAILKLTEDSYQSALNYYQAAILRAANELTNEELAYTQGMQSAEYELELAQADEEQASFVQEQSENELADTIEDHEEVLTEMEERIEELENGEYDEEGTAEAASASMSGGSASGTDMSIAGGTSDDTNAGGLNADALAAETDPDQAEGMTESDSTENINPLDSGMNPGGNTVNDGTEPAVSEYEEQIAMLEEQIAELEEDAAGLDGQIPELEENIAAYEGQIDELTEKISELGEKISGKKENSDKDTDEEETESLLDAYQTALEDYQAALEDCNGSLEDYQTAQSEEADLAGQINQANEEYNAILLNIYSSLGLDTSDFCGAGQLYEDEAASPVSMNAVKTGSAQEPSEAEESATVEAAQTEAAQTEAPQTEAPQTEAPQTEAAQTEAAQTEAAEITVEDVAVVSEESAAQADAGQKNSGTGTASQGTQTADSENMPAALAADDENNGDESLTLEDLIEQLYEKEGDRKSLYDSYLAAAGSRESAEEALLSAIQALTEAAEKLDEAAQKLLEEGEKLESAVKDLILEVQSLTAEGQDLTEAAQALADDWEQIAELERQIAELERQSAEEQIACLEEQIEALQEENEALQEQLASLGSAQASGSDERASSALSALSEDSSLADLAEQAEASGLSGMDASALSGLSGMDASALSGLSGMDTSALSGLSGMDTSALSGMTDASALTESVQLAEEGDLTNALLGINAMQDSESMFGNTYDLSEAKALLERTATDADEAEELLEELYKMQDHVQMNYEELLRQQKPLRLEIQYQYDTTLYLARLAEITYDQTTAALEEELEAAQKSLSDLEEKLQELEDLGDGTVSAAASGTLSAVNYEAEDTLYAIFPMYSLYNTDIVTVQIAVPQSEIAGIAVGEAVEVSLGGFSTLAGTVSAKAVEAQEGNSRTTVNYEVEISIDNSTGRLSSGTAATVTVSEA